MISAERKETIVGGGSLLWWFRARQQSISGDSFLVEIHWPSDFRCFTDQYL